MDAAPVDAASMDAQPLSDTAAHDERPRVLGVRFGANPNSSSLGVDVSFLLFGGAAALGASLALSALLRAVRRPPQVVGAPPPEPAAGPR